MPTPAPNGRADPGALPISLRTTLRLPSAPLSNPAAASVPGVAVVPDATPRHLCDGSSPKTHSRPEPTAPAHAPKDWSVFLPGSPPPHTADTAFVAPGPLHAQWSGHATVVHHAASAKSVPYC